MTYSLNVTPKDVLERYDYHKSSGWTDIHNSIFRARLVTMGDILPTAVKAALYEEDKPAIAYNLPRVYMRTASGAERQSRVDERVFPLQDGSKEVAGALSKWLKWHNIQNHLSMAYSAAFMDIYIGGLAVMENARVVYDDPLGENQTVVGNSLQHMFDLNALRPDSMDMYDQMKEAYLTPFQLAAKFGMSVEDAKGVLRSAHNQADRGPMQLSIFNTERLYADDPLRGIRAAMAHGVTQQDRGRVIEWYYTNYEPAIYLYDLLAVVPEDVTDRDESDVAQMRAALEKAGHPTMVLKSTTRRIYRCVSTDTTVLRPPEPFGPGCFPNTFGIGIRIGNQIAGIVEDLVGPTVGFAKALSAVTEVVAKAPNTGIITASDGELDEETRAELDKIARGRGGWANLQGQTQQPTLVQHNQMQPGLFEYANQHEALTRVIAGSPPSTRGFGEGSHQSGVHAATMIQQGAQSNEIIKDNYLAMRRLTAETNIKFLQHYEGPLPFRTLRVLRDDDSPEEMQFNQIIGDQILNDLSVGKYLVTVDQTPYTVTDRHFKMEQTIAAFQAAQMPIPPDLIFQMQDDPDAEKHGEMVRKYQQEQLEAQVLELAKGRR